MEDCYALIPQWGCFQGEMNECCLPEEHEGWHLNKLEDGGYLFWGDRGSGCDEDCHYCGECFNYREISEEEAKAIIADLSKNNHD